MILKEGDLEFDFDDEAWNHVIKFDEQPEYAKVKNLIPETKGVDFTGILNESSFVAIEVKDFRGFKSHEHHRDLDVEVAQKVVGTLATILGACRTSTHNYARWRAYEKLVQNKKQEVYIILWYEVDPLHSKQKHLSAKRGVLGQKLKSRISWLTSKALVTNCSDHDAHKFRFTAK